MTTVTIDTHQPYEELSRRGFNKEQAEALVAVLKNLKVNNAELAEYKSDVRADFERLDRRILEAKFDILKWVLPLIMGLYGLILFKIS